MYLWYVCGEGTIQIVFTVMFEQQNETGDDFLSVQEDRNSTIIFSYKKGGLPGIDYIVKRMKQVKTNVYTKSVHYKYALNHQNGNAKKNREVLIIGV